MLLKYCTQYVSTFGKLSSGHSIEKGWFSFQSQRRAMTKNVPTAIRLHSFYMLARFCSKSFKLCFSSTWTKNFQIYKLDLEKAEEPEIKLPTFVGSRRKQGNSKTTSTSASLTMLKPLAVSVQFSRSVMSNSLQPHGMQSTRCLHPWDSAGKNTGVGFHFLLQLWLCGSQQTVENSERDGNARPPYLPPEKSLCAFSSVQSLSRVQLFATPRIGARQSSLSITISQRSLRLTSIESVMPSSHLILCCSLLLLPPIHLSIRVFSNESTLCIRWPK